mmetsp:Transcript_49289/g.107277  ORF Transcript_49289/g.107277 Transcript_49289/m.107277 type:complete len:515 (-) Transcript_49289:159-1703(-)
MPSHPREPRPRPTLTWGVMFVLGTMNLIDCINASLLMPYVDKMVSQFLNSSPDQVDVVQTVGLLVGVYPICEVMFSVMWGRLSDIIGRKPVLLIGLAGSAAAPIMMGFAQSLPVAFAARALDGFFCGNIGVTKTYLGEVVDSTNEARGFSLLGVCYSVGLLIGPLMGGQLSEPASWAPQLFGGTIFAKFPFLLPNLVYACLAVVAFTVGLFSLKETLGTQRSSQLLPSARLPRRTAESMPATDSVNPLRYPLQIKMILLGLACISGYANSWIQSFVLLVSLPHRVNGFGFGPKLIGVLQNCSCLGLMMTQLLFYPSISKRYGYKACAFWGVIVNIAVTDLFPAYGLVADPEVFGLWRFAPLVFMVLVAQSAFGFIFPTLFILLNQCMEELGMDRGTVNGWGNTLSALFRGICPLVISGSMSAGIKSQHSGLERYCGVFANTLIALASLGFTLRGCQLREQYQAREAIFTPQVSADGVTRTPSSSHRVIADEWEQHDHHSVKQKETNQKLSIPFA